MEGSMNIMLKTMKYFLFRLNKTIKFNIKEININKIKF